jgi:POT family proton-dependent oligopeptide transporter
MLTLLRGQPRPFFMIFMLEIWERFGFYSVQGILVLYFVRTIGLSNQEAYDVFGTFFALIYVSTPLGGYLGDRFIGTKRIIVVGLLVLALGYTILALQLAHTLYHALGLICIGSALFKASPSVLLANCYRKHPEQLHAGFTLYYMSINIGALASLFLAPYISSRFGYGYAYALRVFGIGVGLLNFWWQRDVMRQIKTATDNLILSCLNWVWLLMVIGIAVYLAAYLLRHTKFAQFSICSLMLGFLGVYVVYMFRADKRARLQMVLALILMLEAIIFFTLYQQMPTSINLFAVNHVYPGLLGMSIDPQSFQVLNPLWIMIISIPIAGLYHWCQQRKIHVSVAYKFAIGMGFCSIGFMILSCAGFRHDAAGMVSSWWLVGSYLFQSLGEILVSALGVAMVAELVPPQIMGFVMGMWFLTSSLSGFTGAAVASLTMLPQGSEAGVPSLMMYTHVFAQIGVTTLIAACMMALLAPFLTRLMRNP